MKEIGKNDYYELFYDESRNWVYWTMKGFWKDLTVVPNFDKDWNMVFGLVKKGFKIYADLSTLRTLPEDVKNANDETQAKLMELGCKKVSCLMDSAVTKLSLNTVLEKNKMKNVVKYFLSSEDIEARKWLDI